MDKERVLIIAAHPDDEALWSGGLIMKAKEDAAVHVLFMVTGECRQLRDTVMYTFPKDRMKEIKAASIYGDFDYKIGFTEAMQTLDALPQKVLIDLIEDTIQDFKPDIVVIPCQSSYNQDHRASATAAISALRPIPPTMRHQPKMILEVEEVTSWPNSFTPNFYIDISDMMEEKLNLYKCHKTQVVEEPYYRSCENLKRHAGLRGSEIGVRYAEGYKLLRGQLWM